jgi:predicted MFS family arabinose efflux permease
MTFVPIESETATFFNITSTEVNALAIVFLFLYVPGTVVSILAYRRFSMRNGMIIGALLNLGVWIRLSALISPKRSYPILMLGQIFAAMAAPFFLNLIALFAARWFAPQQRDIATALGSMANPLGSAIGSLLPSLIVTDGVSSRPFFILLTVEAAFTTLTALLVIVIFRSEPPSPPSPSEEHHQSINVKQDLGRLFTNSHYLILLVGFSIGMAVFNAMTTVLYQLIEPSGYSSENAGIFGAAILISGLFSTSVVGIIMDRTHAYRLLLKVLLLCTSASIVYFIIILRPHMLYPLGVSIALLGFFLMPLLPISFECAVECTYPVRAEWSTGLLLCVGNLLGAGSTFLLGYLIKLAPVYKSGVIFTPASIFIICMFAISGLALFMYKGPYLRLEAERMAATKSTVNT